MSDKKTSKLSNESVVIDIKVENTEQIFSSYSYNKNDRLNKNLSEYIEEKSKRVFLSKNIRLNFHSSESINKEELQKSIKSHYGEEKIDAREELIKSNIFTIIMMALGFITLVLLVTLHNKSFMNFYFEMILEIAAWVFIWEAVYNFFLVRPKIRRRYIKMKKLSNALIELIVSSDFIKGDQNVKKNRRNSTKT